MILTYKGNPIRVPLGELPTKVRQEAVQMGQEIWEKMKTEDGYVSERTIQDWIREAATGFSDPKSHEPFTSLS